MVRRGHGPCGCFGITVEQGSQFFAIFDVVTGLALFLGFLIILLIGELGDKKVYPSDRFNVPREVVITFVFLGFYNATTGLILYFSAGFRNRIGCFGWIVSNIPLALIDFLKIYQMVVVYMLSKEIKHGKVKNVKNIADNEGNNGDKTEEVLTEIK